MPETSRILSPTSPGGLFSPNTGDELTPAEELVVQAMAAGTYFVWREVMGGTKNDVNTVFTIAHAANPASSLLIFYNGQALATGEFTYVPASTNVTLNLSAPPTSTDRLEVTYTRDPN